MEIKNIFFVCELGINHNGDIEIAKKLISLAKVYGADAVKFQKRTPELCVPKEQKNKLKETPWGQMTYLEYRKRIEFGEEEYKEIDRYCKELGIIWFASVWDTPSVDFMEKFNIPIYKIPSAHLTNKELLLKVKSLNKPIILSTGMSTEEEIDKAIKLLEGSDLTLLHCNSAYPAKEKELNLNYIIKLKEKYPHLTIGYSGHEAGYSPTISATTLGAKIIERHITLDCAMWGTDQAASLEPEGLRRLGRDLKKVKEWLGDGIKKVTEDEKIVKKRLRSVETL